GTSATGNAATSAELPEGMKPLNAADALHAQNQQKSATPGNNVNLDSVRDIADEVRQYAPEINWDYAIIQRVNPQDLTSKLIWMNPRKAILEHDEESNLELRPGDIVTIFSQR